MAYKICGENRSNPVGVPHLNKNIPRIGEKNYKIYSCDSCGYYFIDPEIDLTQEE